MSEWVSLDVIDGVGPVAMKRRRPLEGEELLYHEAAVLGAIDHPGVVRLVEKREGPDPALVTHFIGTHSLATSASLSLEEAIAIIGALTETLAELHRLGIRHGAIDPSHVLLGPSRSPVLCGFSGATMPDTPAAEAPTSADDIAALGRLMADLLADHDGLEPIPTRRSWRGRSWDGYRQRALLTLADHCQADDPTSRPTAAGLVSKIGDLAKPDIRSPRRRSTRLASGLHSAAGRVRGVRLRRTRALAAAAGGRLTLALGLAVVGLVAAVFAARSLRPSPTDATAAAEAPSTTAVQTTLRGDTTSGDEVLTDGVTVPSAPVAPAEESGPSAGAVTTTQTCPLPSRDLGADSDGDGCPDGEATVAGHVVTINQERFVLGRPGDRVLVGDWDCDGLVTAVLVRSDPPALWHFPSWAPAEEPVVAVLVRDDLHNESVIAKPDDRGCDGLFVEDARSGASIPVAVSP